LNRPTRERKKRRRRKEGDVGLGWRHILDQAHAEGNKGRTIERELGKRRKAECVGRPTKNKDLRPNW